MIYTITQGDDIVNVIETGKEEYAQLQVQQGQVLHRGRYPRSEYNYDSFTETFGLNDDKPRALVTRNEKEILSCLINELAAQGFTLPSFNVIVRSPKQAYTQVNLAASKACEKYVSEGKFMNIIYMFKEQAVKEWRKGGSIESDAPELLLSWYYNEDFESMDAAAKDIEKQAEDMRNIIGAVERIRLEARNAIKSATGNFDQLIKPYIEQLENL